MFTICKALGIDDPCHWMQSVDPKIVDQWIAFEVCEFKDESKEPVTAENFESKLRGANAKKG